METVEHIENDESCDCPACFVSKKYQADYESYLKLIPYISFEMTTRDNMGREFNISSWLNENQIRGYELTAAHDGLLIMRAQPPIPPTARDIIMEYNRRVEINKDDFGPTIGMIQ